MGISRLGFWVTVGIVALAWTLLFLASRQTVQPGTCPQKERALRPRNEFTSEPWNGTRVLKYRFRDSLNQDVPIECSIDPNRHESLKDGFGLFLCTDDDRRQQLPGTRAACLEGVVTAGQEKEIKIRRSNGFSDWQCGSYVNTRGFRSATSRDKSCKARFKLDYASLATKAAGALGNCPQAMEKKIKSLDDWLAFFQAVPWNEVPAVETDGAGRKKWNAGLLVPTRVMIENWGDCDSKALAFAALQRDRTHLVIFRSTKLLCPAGPEGHAFVGVETNPRSNHKRFNLAEVLSRGIEIDGRTIDRSPISISVGIGVLLEYTIMEVTGPGMTVLGEFDPQKYGLYYGIPLDTRRKPALH